MAKKPTKSDETPAEGPKPPDAAAAGISDIPEGEAPELTWGQAIRAKNLDAFKAGIKKELDGIIAKHAANLSNYAILFLFDDDTITSYHTDRLYSAARELHGKDILLLIDSPGGQIEPAYLISKTLKRLAANKFVVAVPRRAKSAATLICLGADEIHMGMMSQLGPIDPQISGLPTLALGNALRLIAELASKYPGSSEVLAKYLIDQISIRRLGYYERVGESAAQYAERLIGRRQLPSGKTAAEVASHLVNHYKDHGFVIDSGEATDLLGATIVKEQTPEYLFADAVYGVIDFAQLVANRLGKKTFWVIGEAPEGINWRDIDEK
ncbi:SDH family Clp fold serine proteinase [Bradyrhizobium guangzhouense]|nr:ATP-dependent Clp protease proteolytic subunit [Bradyrhizobium guangzhouense]